MSFERELREFLELGEDLPTLPDVVLELQAAFGDEMVGAADITSIIERDPALTAKLLRCANSPVFRRGEPVTSVTTAVQQMGTSNIRSTCLALGVVQSLAGNTATLDHREFWSHSAAVGMAAQRLWRMIPKAPRQQADAIYTAGLLHDVGLLLLDQFFPDRMREVTDVRVISGNPQVTCERDTLGIDHGVIGGRVLTHWELPDVIISAVSHHHAPAHAPEDHALVCRTIHAAEQVCGALGLSLLPEAPVESALDTVVALGVPPDQAEEFYAETEAVGRSAGDFLAV